eukprot:3291697-Rhodomonas_salina.1
MHQIEESIRVCFYVFFVLRLCCVVPPYARGTDEARRAVPGLRFLHYWLRAGCTGCGPTRIDRPSHGMRGAGIGHSMHFRCGLCDTDAAMQQRFSTQWKAIAAPGPPPMVEREVSALNPKPQTLDRKPQV